MQGIGTKSMGKKCNGREIRKQIVVSRPYPPSHLLMASFRSPFPTVKPTILWPFKYTVSSTGRQVEEVAPETWSDWRENKFFQTQMRLVSIPSLTRLLKQMSRIGKVKVQLGK